MLHQRSTTSFGFKSARLATFAAALCMTTAPIAYAQSVNEIVVTARKRAETLQEVPFSINAQTGDVLRNRGATSLEDLAGNVASFTVQNLGPGQSQVAIRGIASGQIARDQPGVKENVSIYLDESVISLSLFTPDLDLFDLSRVEVLRGPQGTLFGTGSEGGLVRYITNQPNMAEYEATIEATGKVVDENDAGGEIKGMINVPIVEDKMALRFVGYVKQIPGFIDAVQPGGGVKEDVNDSEVFGFRAALAIKPNENLTITPRIVYNDVEADGFNRVDIFNILANPFTTTRPPVTLGKRQQFTQFEEKFTDQFWLFDATIEYDAGPVVFTSISSYTDREVLQIRDATQLTASITAEDLGVSFPASVFALDAPLFDATDVELFTQEVRVASNTEGRLEWLLGAYYENLDRRYGQTLDVPGFEAATAAAGTLVDSDAALLGAVSGTPLAGTDTLFFSDIPYQLDQLAFFGEATYAVTDRFDFTAGARWFEFEETRLLNFAGILAAPFENKAARVKGVGWAPRVIATYDVNENVKLNAQASKGYRLGGINDPINIPLCSPADLTSFGGFDNWEEEKVWNFEGGAKATLMDGRAVVNFAGFYSRIRNLQTTLTAGSCSSRIIFNVPKARSIGAEIEVAVQLTDNFDFGISTSYIESEFRSTVVDGGGSVLGGVLKGNRMPTVPQFQLSANATYTQALTDLLDGFLTVNFQHVGSRFTQAGDQDPAFGTFDPGTKGIGVPLTTATFSFNPKMDAYQIGNMRVGVRNEKWELALFVNNIWDERAKLALDQERGSLARVGFLTNTPRTIGITGRMSY